MPSHSKDWFHVKKKEKVLTPEEVARQEAAKWKEGFDEEKQMKFWSRTVVIQPAFDDYEVDIEDLPTREEIVWEMPLELMTAEDRKAKLKPQFNLEAGLVEQCYFELFLVIAYICIHTQNIFAQM